MTQSVPLRSVSWCHRNSAACPRLREVAYHASWSQLLPGKTTTPNLITRDLKCIRCVTRTKQRTRGSLHPRIAFPEENALFGGGGHGLRLFHRTLFGFRGLAIDLPDGRQGDLQNEFALAGFVKLDRDVLVGTEQHGTGTELGVFHLGPGGERRFTGHNGDVRKASTIVG